MLHRVGKVAYKLELLPKLKVHPIFHISIPKHFHVDEEDTNRGESPQAPLRAKTSYDQNIDFIMANPVIRKRYRVSKREYLIGWKGLMKSEVSWEPEEALLQFKKQIDAFHAEEVTRASLE